jgi:hypothetical protein
MMGVRETKRWGGGKQNDVGEGNDRGEGKRNDRKRDPGNVISIPCICSFFLPQHPQPPPRATARGVETGSNREEDRLGDRHHHQDGRMTTLTMMTKRGATIPTAAPPSTAVSNCSQGGNGEQRGGGGRQDGYQVVTTT